MSKITISCGTNKVTLTSDELQRWANTVTRKNSKMIGKIDKDDMKFKAGLIQTNTLKD